MMKPDDPKVKELEALRVAADEAWAAVERQMYAIGYRVGWDAGWRAAQEATTKSLSAQISELEALVRASIPKQAPARPDADFPRLRALLTAADEKRATGALADTLRVISSNPGHRGVELLKIMEASGSPVGERTLRTHLHRLKRAGHIRPINGRWYASGDAPAIAEQGGVP
jgi:hypothetical protein